MIWKFWQRKKKPFTEEQEIAIKQMIDTAIWQHQDPEFEPEEDEKT